MDIILDVKNMFEIEGEISCRTSQFKFLNRSLPIFTLSTHRIEVGATTFFVRPFPLVEEDKPLMDKFMQKLVSLGILTKNSTTHTSPVMLVAGKGNERKRPVIDFRLLNTRIVRRNTSTPLLRDIFIMLGRAQCEVLSCVDLKEAFCSLPLTPEAKSSVVLLP